MNLLPREPKKYVSAAFTLVELTVVIAVISIVTSIAIISSSSIQKSSRETTRQAKVETIASTLEKYYQENNEYPSVALMTAGADTVKNRLGLVDSGVLVMPSAPTSATTSFTNAAPSGHQVQYIAGTTDASQNSQCQNDVNGYCDAFELRYVKETDNSAVVIKSAQNEFVAFVPPCEVDCLASPSTPTVSGASINPTLVRITSSSVICSVGTPEYKIRHAASSAGLPAWDTLTWSTDTVKNVNPGSDTTIYFQAAARCIEGVNTSPQSQSTVQSVNVGTPPSAPIVSASTVSASSIQLTWNAVSGASSYAVTGAGNASSCTSSPCTVTGLASSTTYTFYVTASNSFGTSPAGSASATTQAPACTYPTTPTLYVSSSGTNSVSLNWSTSSGSTPMTYYIYYGTTSNPSSYYTGTSATSITVNGLSQGTTYFFRIYASNDCGGSGYSNTVSATTSNPCSVPGSTTLSTNSPSSSSISLSWGSASGATGYNIYYGTSSPGSNHYTSTSGTSATVSGLSSSTTYYFRVQPYNSCGNGSYSNTASATTSAVSYTLNGSQTSQAINGFTTMDWYYSPSNPPTGSSFTLSGTSCGTMTASTRTCTWDKDPCKLSTSHTLSDGTRTVSISSPAYNPGAGTINVSGSTVDGKYIDVRWTYTGSTRWVQMRARGGGDGPRYIDNIYEGSNGSGSYRAGPFSPGTYYVDVAASNCRYRAPWSFSGSNYDNANYDSTTAKNIN